MRTIKFRGYSDELKSFVYGFYQEVNVNGVVYSYIFWQGNTTPVRTDSIGQFIGLHDKNGKEIYEGDFITYSGITSNGQKIIRVVNYNSDYARFQGGMYPLSETKNLIEVIGNIYENPELLTD